MSEALARKVRVGLEDSESTNSQLRAIKSAPLSREATPKKSDSIENLDSILLRTDLPLQHDINSTIRLAANVLEAHSVSLTAPTETVRKLFSENHQVETKKSDDSPSTLICSHTLSPDSTLSPGGSFSGGPLSWVSKAGKSLQITPFERDSRTLGIYKKSIPLKSVAAVPVKFPFTESVGILAADSLKSYKFTPLQMKLLGELAENLARLIELNQLVESKIITDSHELRDTQHEVDSDENSTVTNKVQRFIAYAKGQSRLFKKKSMALVTITRDPSSLLLDDRETLNEGYLALYDELPKVWKLISEWIATKCRSYGGNTFTPVAFSAGNGRFYILCDHLEAATLISGARSIIELAFQRKIKPHLLENENDLIKRAEGAIEVERIDFKNWIKADDSLIRGLYKYLG